MYSGTGLVLLPEARVCSPDQLIFSVMKHLFLVTGLCCALVSPVLAQKDSDKGIRYMTEPRDPMETGRGAVVQEPRDVPTDSIYEVVVGNGIQLHLVSDSAAGVVLAAQPNILPLVATTLNGHRLTVRLTAGLETPIGIVVNMPLGALNKIHLKEGAHLSADMRLQKAQLELFFESGSEGACALQTNQLRCTVMGGSQVQLSGMAAAARFAVKGGSILKASKLETISADITVLGASECTAAVEKALKARVENESRLTYFGMPPTLETHTDLNGKIRARWH